MDEQEQTMEKNSGLFKLTNLNYESWAPNAMEHLLNYPGPWEWIRTGLEPTYPTPPLEIPGEIQPCEAQVGGRGRGNGAGRGVAVRRGRGGRQGRGIFDVLDEDDE
jgi:hypothetical protein